MILVLIGAYLVNGLRGYQLPDEWITNTLRAGNEVPDPVSMDGILTSGGLLFGLGAGRFLGIGRRAMVVFSFQIVRALPNIGSLSDIMPQLRHKSWV